MYFAAVPSPSGKGFVHHAARSLNELAHRIAHLEQGAINVYYACSGFREEHIERTAQGKNGPEVRRVQRVKENVKLVKSFWLDLDVGTGKKYTTQGEAVLGLAAFLKTTGLPTPLVVSSGYGVHVYWPLTTALLPGQWRATALQLKALTYGLELHADPVRTADEASVLRPVGTHNRKNAVAVPVFTITPREGLPTLSDPIVFHATIMKALEENDIDAEDTNRSGKMKVNPEDMIVPVGGWQKVSAIRVADRCAQMKSFRETGGVTEPHWYHSLQVMQHTIEGEKLGHEWSKVHAGYVEADTEDKLTQVRGMGPTLCAKFKDVNPDGCKNCPFAGKISTPLQLGTVIEEAKPPVVTEVIDGAEREVTLPSPPWPFKRGAGDQPGLYVEVEQGVPVRFYPFDLYLTAIMNDEGKREGAMCVKHWLPQEGWREFNMPLWQIETPREFLGSLRNNFINPENGKYMVTYMDSYLRELQAVAKIKQLHTKMGWLPDRSFLLGAKRFARDGTYPAGLSSTVSTKIVASYHTQGEHAKWQEAILKFDRPGLEAHLFSVLIGFGAPLFKLTGHGGIIASMLGETNAGKTLSARAMASIYGSFDPFKAGKTDTINARIERLGMLSNLPVYLDETTNIEAEEVSELMYQISQGSGKTRLRSDSTVREAAEWSTIVLTSGNRSMVGRLMEAKVDPEAELVRLFEYTVPKLAWFEAEMTSIYESLEENYGYAGETFIKYLVKLDETEVKLRMRETGVKFAEHVGFEGKERFWYSLVGTVLYGLAVAHQSGALVFPNLGETFGRIHSWCKKQIVHQRETVSGTRVSPLEALSMYLNQHLAERIVVIENRTGMGDVMVVKQPAAHGKLYVEYNQTTGIINIDQNHVRNWLSRNQFNPEHVRDSLVTEGVLMSSGEKSRVTLGKGTQYRGGQVRAWRINAKHRLLDGIDAVLQRDTGEVKP